MLHCVPLKEDINYFLEKCDDFYFPKHVEASIRLCIAAGVDVENRNYCCPKGHKK